MCRLTPSRYPVRRRDCLPASAKRRRRERQLRSIHARCPHLSPRRAARVEILVDGAAARIKFHRLRGQHGAFWMQPLEAMYPGGTGHEIDVIEYFGDNHNRAGLTTFIHRYEGDQVVKIGSRITDPRSLLKSRRDRWSKTYHVFSVQWTPQTLRPAPELGSLNRLSGP